MPIFKLIPAGQSFTAYRAGHRSHASGRAPDFGSYRRAEHIALLGTRPRIKIIVSLRIKIIGSMSIDAATAGIIRSTATLVLRFPT
jgi:hypothetical protein